MERARAGKTFPNVKCIYLHPCPSGEKSIPQSLPTGYRSLSSGIEVLSSAALGWHHSLSSETPQAHPTGIGRSRVALLRRIRVASLALEWLSSGASDWHRSLSSGLKNVSIRKPGGFEKCRKKGVGQSPS